MDLGTSKYARCRQKKGKEDRSENPNKVQDPSGKTLFIPATSAQVPNGQETSISEASDDSVPCPETPGKGEGRTKIPSNQTSENKKTKNDGARGFSIATDATSLDISDQGERNDTGKKPRVLLIKKISERYKKLKHLRQESQKPGDIWLLDYAIMNQTTEGHEQETVVLVIIDAYSSLVRVIPCKKLGNVLPHILDTITL